MAAVKKHGSGASGVLRARKVEGGGKVRRERKEAVARLPERLAAAIREILAVAEDQKTLVLEIHSDLMKELRESFEQ